MKRFVMGRTADLRACGTMTSLMIWPKESPIERAASIWPTPIVLMPVMKFSEPKAEATRTTTRMTQVRSLHTIPR